MPFAPEYIALVLTDNFEDAKAGLLAPLITIHRAHLAMLLACGIMPREDGRRVRAALDSIDPAAVRAAVYDGRVEDLFFFVERLLADRAGAESAGRLHTGRSRNDIDMTMYRMRLRGWIRGLIAAVLGTRGVLITQAARHRAAIFPAHTHTQPAQPTTVGHYLLAVIEQLERDTTRLFAAYATTNRCPLGACAITGTGFRIDRAQTSALLGFAEPTGNTYGSIATVDYLLESAGAAATALVGLGRFVQDMLLWATVEVGYLRLADGFVQTSSIMPQKRNPVGLEHARALASKALVQLAGLPAAVHNTPFGDIVDTEDDLQPLAASGFRDAVRAIELTGAALRDAAFDTERMRQRAREGWVTITEVADALTRQHKLPFARAHAIAAELARTCAPAEDRAVLARTLESSAARAGFSLRVSADDVAEWLDPDRFIEIRRTPGGPSGEQIDAALARARTQLAADAALADEHRLVLESASERLGQALREM